jgi:hypothetical protein
MGFLSFPNPDKITGHSVKNSYNVDSMPLPAARYIGRLNP